MKNKYCTWCNFLHIDHCVFEGCANFSCVLTPNRKQFLDSAEFEARVAAFLTIMVSNAYHDGFSDGRYKRHYKLPRWKDNLKEARLAVEEEMDGR